MCGCELLCRLFQVSDLHFVHFFAPSNLSPLPKNIVFVIDVSGSMWGVKMKQVSCICLSCVKRCRRVAVSQNALSSQVLL